MRSRRIYREGVILSAAKSLLFPMERKEALKKIAGTIRDRKSFLISSHVDPDGDCIGSQLALLSLLEDLGKEAEVIDPSPIPERYQFLPGWEKVRVVKDVLPHPLRFTPEAWFVLDAGKWDRIGDVAGLVPSSCLIVNLDHHEANPGFGGLALVDPEVSSTCELLYDLFLMMEWKPTPGQATCLYTGILTDTSGFRNPNTSPRALEIAAALVRDGADPSWIWDQVWGQQKPGRLRLLGEVLSSLELSGQGQIGTFTLSKETWQRIGVKLEESEDFISHAMGVRGVRVAMFLREKGDGLIRVSLRARNGVDVNRIAAAFGGGGHPQAAGFKVQGEMQEVKRQTLNAVARALGVPLSEGFHE